MPHFLTYLADFAGFSRYILVFAAAFVEGPVVMMTAGFLFHIGKLQFFPMYVALVAGDFVADVMWYMFGYFGARKAVLKYGKFFKITPEVVFKIEDKLRHHESKILFISKLTMGFGLALPILIVAGMLKVSFKKYVVFNLAGGLVWALFLVFIGYTFGNIYVLIPGSFKVLFIIAVVSLFLGIATFAKRKLTYEKI